MNFEGSPHSGIDDATNIARIAIKLLNDGCCLSLNEQISVKHNPKDGKSEVRYEVYHEPKPKYSADSDQDSSDNKKPKGKSHQRKENDQQGEMVEKFENLTVDTESESSDEALDDLLCYYKIQKS